MRRAMEQAMVSLRERNVYYRWFRESKQLRSQQGAQMPCGLAGECREGEALIHQLYLL